MELWSLQHEPQLCSCKTCIMFPHHIHQGDGLTDWLIEKIEAMKNPRLNSGPHNNIQYQAQSKTTIQCTRILNAYISPYTSLAKYLCTIIMSFYYNYSSTPQTLVKKPWFSDWTPNDPAIGFLPRKHHQTSRLGISSDGVTWEIIHWEMYSSLSRHRHHYIWPSGLRRLLGLS